MNKFKRVILKWCTKGFPAPPKQFTNEDTRTGEVTIFTEDLEDIILYLNEIETWLKE